MNKLIVALLLIFLSSINSFAQKEYSNWHFGDKTGISFSNNNYNLISNSSMLTFEACATISNKQGNVLFYTNSEKIWSRNNLVMPNASNLDGGSSSTQTAILKQPLSNNRYYVFTISPAEALNRSFKYSVVDINLNSGFGDITSEKNIILKDSIQEQICIVKHSNNVNYWIIIYDNINFSFNAYLLDENGINTIPIISTFNLNNQDSTIQNGGQLKCNKHGNKIAAALWGEQRIEIFDFDNNTGILSNKEKITGFELPYGVEFSSNGNYLYISDMKNYTDPSDSSIVYQIKLNAGSLSQIQNSKQAIAKTNYLAGQLQIGPNNKIYIAKFGRPFLDLIVSPNQEGNLCNYQTDGIVLNNTNTSFYGLPNIPNDAYNYTYSSSNYCVGDVTNFEFHSSFTDSLLWDFGNPSSVLNNSNDTLAYHIFPEARDYYTSLTVYTHDFIDTIYDTISMMISPGSIFLPNDTILCTSDTLFLNLQDNNTTFYWEDDSENANRIITTANLYYVTALNSCGTSVDSINVDFNNCKSCILEAPDAFTPNNDGRNDFFSPIEKKDKKITSFKVYNRWGKLIHNSTEKWGGKYKDVPQKAEIYSYTYTVTCNDDFKTYIGQVSLLR